MQALHTETCKLISFIVGFLPTAVDSIPIQAGRSLHPVKKDQLESTLYFLHCAFCTVFTYRVIFCINTEIQSCTPYFLRVYTCHVYTKVSLAGGALTPQANKMLHRLYELELESTLVWPIKRKMDRL